MTSTTSSGALRRAAATVALTCGVVAGLGACSFSFGESKVEKSKIESEIGKLYQQKAGVAASQVTCEDDLKAEQGATVDCAVSGPDGVWRRVDVEATSVDGDDVNYNMTIVSGSIPAPTW